MRSSRNRGWNSALRVALLFALVSVVGASLSGCIWLESEDPPEWLTGEIEEETQTAQDSDSGPLMPGDGHGHSSEVLMMGRSVMEGWMSHWEWNWEDPVQREGFSIYFYGLESPPTIGQDAASRVEASPDGTVLFFKLCFDDFWADSDADVKAMTAQTLGFADEVIAQAENRDVTLILGNALPKVAADTNAPLVRLHQAYNAGLEERASAHDNVFVFDQYSLLTSGDGSLSRGLAVAADDSHLNDIAYEVLDQEFFGLLDSLP